MALTRSYLKGMGINEEQIEAVIESHTETVNALKAQRDNYKADAEKLAEVQSELNAIKAKGDDGWQAKYEKEHSDFEAYKNDVVAKETRGAKESAYKALLTDAGVSEKAFKLILNATDFDGLELDSDGKLKGSEELSTAIKTEYADFVTSTDGKGAEVQIPPENNGGITKEAFQSMGYNDRLKLYNEQPELYKALNE